ncbi:type II toxin-antitoxin system RelE/ParE family toxin [uncultured Polaribacter sp.]|uniref:type II toxin-antitoxin system RelE/ParE family toxin n=1 Tax=uncultured Polaribacter sp. TaxID=174711 RepID=UPI00262BBA78|nr:type II toxin-antitoxin system RelE/ParE family toxin [uncultured Polaribacter sp.]
MENGYKILWTDHALKELADTYEYLKIHFSERELKRLSTELHNTLNLISRNPFLFPLSENKKVRKVVIRKFNTMYYREKQNHIEILSFFSNRQNPNKRKI